LFKRALKRMLELIHQRSYVMTLHAEEEMSLDDLSVFDIERVILTGMIIERQRDTITLEWKYRVRGETLDGSTAECVVKMGPTGKLVFITVYTL